MSWDELLGSINQLHYRVDELNKLELELPPPPLPLQADLEQALDDGLGLDALHGKMDDWSPRHLRYLEALLKNYSKLF